MDEFYDLIIDPSVKAWIFIFTFLFMGIALALNLIVFPFVPFYMAYRLFKPLSEAQQQEKE